MTIPMMIISTPVSESPLSTAAGGITTLSLKPVCQDAGM
eukprot:CAMPEP_0114115838 /NCGR_PEP_ID=MMETSP0043_2-20121206/4180_1 /TAXON_ID=464988 /ORGANISM="Hemiselmis andersenii, Strain CCMP644" /LENGTH=38 /DNA_ID= /DNA_START= /DNA_END= /DNA_ORIENTATION=